MLRDSGKRAEARTVEQAVFALAEARGGVLSTLDVAQVLSISDSEADAQLTDFAKRYPERVRVELDPNGTLVYEFPQYMLATANTVAASSVDFVTLEEQQAATRGAASKQRR